LFFPGGMGDSKIAKKKTWSRNVLYQGQKDRMSTNKD
jgi:hypothetical protein